MSVKFDPRDVARMNRALVELERETGASAAQANVIGAQAFCRSARRATPRARKTRSVQVTSYGPPKLYGMWTFVRPGNSLELVPVSGPDSRRRPIRNRNFAKATWTAAARALGKGSEAMPAGVSASAVRRYARGKARLTGLTPFAEVESSFRAIADLDVGTRFNRAYRIAAQGMAAGARAVERRLSIAAARYAGIWRG